MSLEPRIPLYLENTWPAHRQNHQLTAQTDQLIAKPTPVGAVLHRQPVACSIAPGYRSPDHSHKGQGPYALPCRGEVFAVFLVRLQHPFRSLVSKTAEGEPGRTVVTRWRKAMTEKSHRIVCLLAVFAALISLPARGLDLNELKTAPAECARRYCQLEPPGPTLTTISCDSRKSEPLHLVFVLGHSCSS